jgi:hypothetical protein
MAGLVPAIHAFDAKKDVDARDKRGHDEFVALAFPSSRPACAAARAFLPLLE